VADRELAELGDPLLDDGPPVVEPPGGEPVDAFDVGEHVSSERYLVGIELKRATSSASHASAPSAVWALPARQRTPTLSPLILDEASSG